MEFNEAIKLIRDVKDFPIKGVVFKDLSPLFENPEAFSSIINELALVSKKNFKFDKLVCIESRGFILGSALALKLGVPFSLVRKPGKLPGEVYSLSYDLEYGSDTLEILKSSLSRNDKVLILDDILATGGTLKATEELCKHTGADIVGSLCLMELSFLNGKEKLEKPFLAPLVI